MTQTNPFPPGAALVAYLRDSGGEDQDLSVEQQETAIRAWCEERGYRLTHTFRDTRSGTSTVGRSGFEQMIRHFSAKKPAPEAGLVLWRYNRFARDLDDAQYFKAALRRRGYTLHAIQDPIPEGSAGRAIEFFIDWMADKFSEDLSVDVRRGLHHLAEQHGALGGTPPRGFRREPIDLGKHRDGSPHIVHRWVPDENTWETCRLAWTMRAQGASYSEIHQKTRLFGSKNSYNGFYRNRIYLGELKIGDQVLKNYCEPLIDQATWDAVQEISRKRTKAATASEPDNIRRRTSPYILSGLAYCTTCGSLLTSITVRPARGEPRNYYQCLGVGRYQCTAHLLPKAPLEQAVIDKLTEDILTPPYIQAILDEQRTARADESISTAARRAEIARQLRAIRLKITNITDAIAEGGQSRALLNRLSDLENDETNRQSELDQIDAWLKTAPINFTPERLERFTTNLRFILNHADLDAKRKILRGLVARVDVIRTGKAIHGQITIYTPTDDLVAMLAAIPSLDDLTGPDPPVYAIAPPPSGGTIRLHTIPINTQIKRRS